MNYTPDDKMQQVDNMEALILDAMGPADALDAITRALDYDTKREVFAYIIRCYDLKGGSDNEGGQD